jgi:hypothetical protein
MNSKTGRPVDAVSLASVLGKITQARALFDPETTAPLREGRWRRRQSD